MRVFQSLQNWTTVIWMYYTENVANFHGKPWHRNDMIRFGKFEDAYGFKTDNDPNHRIFPIPTVALSTNPNLQQNPGY